MLMKEIEAIIKKSKKAGWVLEPDAKKIMKLSGFDVPRSVWAKSLEESLSAAKEIGFPVVAKVVSPDIMHKSDSGGVAVGISDAQMLEDVYRRFEGMPGFQGALVEETVAGLELIVGAKIDIQFGPVVLLGLGGVEAEIYNDSVIRMAPLEEKDVTSMFHGLKAGKLLEGYRGSEKIDLSLLISTLIEFSKLVVHLEKKIESVDLNPVMCSSKRCVVADARIILAGG